MPYQKRLIDSHTDPNKSKIKGYLNLEDIFGFCKTFKKVTKNVGFHLMFKTNDLKDIILISMGDDIKVTINSLYRYIPKIIPSVQTQLMFNEATQSNCKVSSDDWYTERRLISDLLVQHDIVSAEQLNSPKYLIGAPQTQLRTITPHKKLILQ